MPISSRIVCEVKKHRYAVYFDATGSPKQVTSLGDRGRRERWITIWVGGKLTETASVAIEAAQEAYIAHCRQQASMMQGGPNHA